MSQVTDPILLDSTGQDIVTQLAAISARLAAGLPGPYAGNPAMDGTASPGSSTLWARGDHVHPSDTSKQDVLTFDATPTANSTNPVTSGGTKAALDVKANQSLLAYVETGSTASRAYAVGVYFCWNGLLYRAKTAIGKGDTFTENTNCEVVTGGGINDLFGKKATVLFGTTGASSETLTVSAGRFLIILATRGDTSFTFAVVYRYNNWKLEGKNTAGVTIDANTGQITLLNYTHYKIIY